MTRPEVASRSASWASLAGGVGAVLLPKCALCFAAYGSALSALGLGPSVHERFMEPIVALGVAASVALVLVLSARRRDVLTPLASLGGASLVAAGRYYLELPAVTAAGAALLVGAALVNAARCRKARPAPVSGGSSPA
jgi:hypothetical protein